MWRMRAPEFWSGQATGRDSALMLQALLTPVSWIYGWAVARKIAHAKPERVGVPVVCVGNLTLGGAGKTPVTRIVRRLLGDGAHVLMRGYGGREKGPLQVTPAMDHRDVGDEALLHAKDGPTWIARDRAAGAKAAIAAGARAIVMDDGFQNPSLAKDLSIVVIDAAVGVGNRKVFPAGPLRERLNQGVARASAFVLMGVGDAPWLEAGARPVLRARIASIGAAPEGPLVAFAGIARPEKFFDTLSAMGADVSEAVPYDDHHAFSESELDWLATLARERGARLITTEKDHVRLPAARRGEIAALNVAARFEDEAALAALLAPIAAGMR